MTQSDKLISDEALEKAIISWLYGNKLAEVVDPVEVQGLIKNIQALLHPNKHTEDDQILYRCDCDMGAYPKHMNSCRHSPKT